LHANEPFDTASTILQAALFAAVPVISIDDYFSSLEEHVSNPIFCDVIHSFQTSAREVFSCKANQVVAEFPATFKGHDTILRVHSHRLFVTSTLPETNTLLMTTQHRVEVARI
jgi:hypothetical protein